MVKHASAAKLPLRDLISHIENKCRELNEHLKMDLGSNVGELHKLTRPKRKSSSFPSIRSVCTTHERVLTAHRYALELCAEIEDCAKEIQRRATARQV